VLTARMTGIMTMTVTQLHLDHKYENSNDKNEYILKSDSTFNIDISLIQIDPPMGSGRFYPNDSIYWWRNFLFGDKTRYFYGSKE